MPNDCENRLALCGPVDNIQDILNRLRVHADTCSEPVHCANDARVFSFAALVPPEGGVPVQAAWSTSQEAYHCARDDTLAASLEAGPLEMKIGFRFCSAWCPPKGFLRRLARAYPYLLIHLRYAEPGALLHGKYVYKGGWIRKATRYFNVEPGSDSDDASDDSGDEDDDDDDAMEGDAPGAKRRR